ncbi:MAG: hypothetical protein GXP51_12675 [Deltaproteobacteria bacterium]|nr:hypothetical protein [Deltaproteobacteria bacterium]
MNKSYYTNHEVVSRLIHFCHQNEAAALRIYEEVVVGQNRSIQLPDGKISLSQKQLEEVIARFSSEVGPAIWQSKSGKY